MKRPSLTLPLPQRKLLIALATYNMLTVDQATRLLYASGSPNYVQEHLYKLFLQGFLDRSVLDTDIQRGSKPWVYYLNEEGRKVLHVMGVPVKALRYKTGSLMLTHTLACNEPLIAAELWAKDNPSVQLRQLVQERDLKRLGGKAVPDGWVDLLLQRDDMQYQLCLAFEVDKGTEYETYFRVKIASLIRWASRPFLGARDPDSIIIAFLVQSTKLKRMEKVLGWIEKTVIEEGEGRDLFYVAEVNPAYLEPAAFFAERLFVTPFERTFVSLVEVDGA